ncbi:MAG: tripartite tricarboxylate transporter TctB family protein [Acidobacteriota bacterium]
MEPLKKERFTAIFILIVVMLILLYIIPNYIETSGEYEVTGLSPAFFPVIAAIFMGLLSCLLLILTFIKKWSHFFNSEGEIWLSRSEEMKAGLACAIIVGYYFALKFTGFFIATPPVILGLFFLQGERKIVKSIIIALVVTISVYFLFNNLLNVQFPGGKLFK